MGPGKGRHGPRHEITDLTPFQDAINEKRRAGVPMSLIARRAGFFKQRRRRNRTWMEPDGSRVLRLVGMRTSNGAIHRSLDYDTALCLAEALGLDPVDVGL